MPGILRKTILGTAALTVLIGTICPYVEARSPNEVDPPASEKTKEIKPVFRKYLDSHLIPTFTDGFDRSGFVILGAGAVAGILAHQVDDNVNRFFTSKRHASQTITDIGNFFGTRYFNLIAAGVQMIWDPTNGLAHVEGILGANLMVFAMKKSVSRVRPNGKDDDSFPSGHTATAFASSGSLDYAYGTKAAIPAYTLTALTILARLQENEHWFSDVMVATSIGIFWARASGIHHNYLTPIIMKDGGGIRFSLAL